jgi:hypothetical protein
MTDPKIQETVDKIKEKFEKKIEEIATSGSRRINEITDDSPDPNNVEATLNVTFDVKWKTTSIKFDIPTFRNERKDISFHVPSVTMKTREISWDEPAVKMVTKCITKKPEVTCGGFPPSCTVKMKCIYADVPEPYMKRRVIKFDVPEISMKQQNVSFDVPEISFETIEIKLDLPQFYLRSLSGELKDQQDDIEDVSTEMETEINKAKNQMDDSLLSEVSAQITALYDEIEISLIEERKNVSNYYDDAIAKMKSTIKILKANDANDEVAQLEPKLSSLIADYSEVLNQIDQSIENLHVQEADAINGIKLN